MTTEAAALMYLRQHPYLLAYATMDSWARRGVKESSHNAGRDVSAIIQSGGGDPDERPAWCAYAACDAWIRGCDAAGVRPDFVTSGGCARLWHRNPTLQITIDQVRSGQVVLRPGDIYIRGRDAAAGARIRNGGTDLGHCGLTRVLRKDLWISTAEGNTDSEDSREGDGVYRKIKGVSLDDPRLVGFIRPKWKNL